MKKLLVWTIAAVCLMAGGPWAAATFGGTHGMAACLVLFFAINPVFSAVCGAAAGKHIRQLWPLPLIVPTAFLAGTWLSFEMGETDFLLYCGGYLIIGLASMLISAFLKKNPH